MNRAQQHGSRGTQVRARSPFVGDESSCRDFIIQHTKRARVMVHPRTSRNSTGEAIMLARPITALLSQLPSPSYPGRPEELARMLASRSAKFGVARTHSRQKHVFPGCLNSPCLHLPGLESYKLAPKKGKGCRGGQTLSMDVACDIQSIVPNAGTGRVLPAGSLDSLVRACVIYWLCHRKGEKVFPRNRPPRLFSPPFRLPPLQPSLLRRLCYWFICHTRSVVFRTQPLFREVVAQPNGFTTRGRRE